MSCGHLSIALGNEQWVWLAIDAQTREIVGLQVGDRSTLSAQGLWDSLPPVYRQCAVIYTDHWSAYGAVLPKKRHRSVDKDSGLTSYPHAIQLHPKDNGYLGWSESAYRFPRSWRITLPPFGMSVHHYNATRRRKLDLT